MKLRTIRGVVVAIDEAAGTVTLDVPYTVGGYKRPDSPPVTVPIPAAMPAWCRQAGAEFTCRRPADRQQAADLEDPTLLTEFGPPEFWWWTVEELERLVGFRQPPLSVAEEAAIVARRPAEYAPPAPDGCQAVPAPGDGGERP